MKARYIHLGLAATDGGRTASVSDVAASSTQRPKTPVRPFVFLLVIMSLVRFQA